MHACARLRPERELLCSRIVLPAATAGGALSRPVCASAPGLELSTAGTTGLRCTAAADALSRRCWPAERSHHPGAHLPIPVTAGRHPPEHPSRERHLSSRLLPGRLGHVRAAAFLRPAHQCLRSAWCPPPVRRRRGAANVWPPSASTGALLQLPADTWAGLRRFNNLTPQQLSLLVLALATSVQSTGPNLQPSDISVTAIYYTPVGGASSGRRLQVCHWGWGRLLAA